MKHEQKVVLAGAISGVLLMIVGLWYLTLVMASPIGPLTVADRIAYALGANVFALVPLFIMLVTVGNARFFSEAIDPTRHAEDKHMKIDGRVADNTLQQNFVFFVATLAVSTVIPSEQLQLIWAAAAVFVVARFIFWIGYRFHPLYRAPGMSATAYLNLGIIFYTLLRLFKIM